MKSWCVPVLSLSLAACAPDGGAEVVSSSAAASATSGKRLFERETFGGNGRTCRTCHSEETGTVSPEEAAARFANDPGDPLFAHDGSDDGLGNGVTRLTTRATIRVEIPLPPNVHLADDPAARSVVLNRGIPTTLNTPALDPVLMYDARAATLEDQALGAVLAHAQPLRLPTSDELARIAAFETTGAFFSSDELRDFAAGGDPPRLPRGRTEAEQRGRRFFVDAPPTVEGEVIVTKEGACAVCHSGPMLDTTNEFAPLLGFDAGQRIFTAFVSELNTAGNPVREFVFTRRNGTTSSMVTPDPGLALTIGVNTGISMFKIPTLWGVKRTAPYFHDNSALTLEEVAEHYRQFFAQIPPTLELTDQDLADIVAYLKLL